MMMMMMMMMMAIKVNNKTIKTKFTDTARTPSL